MRRRPAIAVCVIVAALAAGLVSVRTTQDQLEVIAACDALNRGEHSEALRRTEGRIDTSEIGRTAAECRCRALAATGRMKQCVGLMERLLADAVPDHWMPGIDIAIAVIETRRARGDREGAARLARRAGIAHPTHPAVFALEIDTRANVEPEDAVLSELTTRIPDRGPESALLRAQIAQRHLRRGESQQALDVLGASAPEGAGSAIGVWFDTRATAFAMADDLTSVQKTHDAWLAAGGDPTELSGRYALTLSIAGLHDPEQDIIDLLRTSLGDLEPHPDIKLRKGLAVRLMLTLAASKRYDEALAVYDRYANNFSFEGITRAELLRAERQHALANATVEEKTGTISFRVPNAPMKARVLISPTVDAPVDTPFEPHAVSSDRSIEIERIEGEAPVRWVLRTNDQVYGSGTITPRAGSQRTVTIIPRDPKPVQTLNSRSRRSANNHRRVFQLLLDCGDWRIIEYLRARGELPTFSALIESGHRAVLHSDPPLTAAALEALVWPERHSETSTLGIIHQMGVELSGLASVGENPFSALRWLLPNSTDLFGTIGATERKAANLLLAHGGIRAGRHGEVSGPNGMHSVVPIGSAARDLHPEERHAFEKLHQDASEIDTLYVRTIAAEFDAAEELANDRALDLVSLRIEPLDILTHAHFARIVADGQDDADELLFDVYRYIDTRLAKLDAALDADDVLIVMSDHGIRTAMEHSEQALFIAVGDGVPVGRANGQPKFRGVSRVIADVLGIPTEWPDTGIAPWADKAHDHETARRPDDPTRLNAKTKSVTN